MHTRACRRPMVSAAATAGEAQNIGNIPTLPYTKQERPAGLVFLQSDVEEAAAAMRDEFELSGGAAFRPLAAREAAAAAALATLGPAGAGGAAAASAPAGGAGGARCAGAPLHDGPAARPAGHAAGAAAAQREGGDGEAAVGRGPAGDQGEGPSGSATEPAAAQPAGRAGAAGCSGVAVAHDGAAQDGAVVDAAHGAAAHGCGAAAGPWGPVNGKPAEDARTAGDARSASPGPCQTPPCHPGQHGSSVQFWDGRLARVDAAEAAGAEVAAPGARVELRRARALWAAAGYLPDNPLVRPASVLCDSDGPPRGCACAARPSPAPRPAGAVSCATRVGRPATVSRRRSLSSLRLCCEGSNKRCAAQGVRTEREVHVLQQSGQVHRVLLVRQ